MWFYKTKVVKYITFSFASAITLFPFVLIDPKTRVTRRLIQHEKIHGLQQLELLLIPFYLLYVSEFLCRMIFYKSFFKAYKNISFEQECYDNEDTPNYLKCRKPYSWIKYLK